MSHAPKTETASPGNARERSLVNVQPHRWALSWWARFFRRIARRWTVNSHVRKFCQPLTTEGAEKLVGLEGPLLIIANHTSHFDTVIVLDLLPNKIYDRTAIVAAADRMYRQRIKGMWYSLRYNSFPITRGGGMKSLAYSQWLLDHGWSLVIFPEGRRSRTGELQKFHPGPALLATDQLIPILPIYISGASNILPPGTRESKPAPVHVRIGDVIRFAEGTQIPEAKSAMEEAMKTLAAAGN